MYPNNVAHLTKLTEQKDVSHQDLPPSLLLSSKKEKEQYFEVKGTWI